MSNWKLFLKTPGMKCILVINNEKRDKKTYALYTVVRLDHQPGVVL
jgi:hypothetical protein